MSRGVHQRVPHAKNQPPMLKTVACSLVNTQTDRHTEKAKKEGTYSSRNKLGRLSLGYAFQYELIKF